MSTPGRTDMLMKPTRVTHQALLSDQGLNIVVVFAHLGPLQAEALQQLASVGKTSRFWGLRASEREGFKGESTQGILKDGETQGVLGQTSEGMQWVWGESKAKRFDGEQTLLNEGKARSFTANRQMWGVLGKPRRSFEHPWAYKYA